jgi:hypothetical protein
VQSKEFLLHELENVERTLQDTLRHNYPPGTSAEFYTECTLRIGRLRTAIDALSVTDTDALEEYGMYVSEISLQVSMIERSHLGEFSWPFAQRLEEIALELCKEPGPKNPLPPIIQILADGGIASYRIYTEWYWPSSLRFQRILHIVFPRTNKYHVLLHAIFGHEIGHAAYAIPSLESALDKNVFTPLFAGTPLADVGSAQKWIEDSSRPSEVDRFMHFVWEANQRHDFTFLGRNNYSLEQWHQELFCDLFGLMMFGPTFAGAMNALLGSMNPRGESISETHPPFACRANLIVRALRRLGYLNHSATGDAELDAAVASTASYFQRVPSSNPWYELFTDKNVDDAIAGIHAILSPIPKALYTNPAAADLVHVVSNLRRGVPPCGSRLHPTEPKPEPFPLDFRHILYGGWIAWLGQKQFNPATHFKFLYINRLCERGILQQIAVERTR